MFHQVLVFLFLIRLRFPKDVSIAHVLRRRYGSSVLQQYRSYEKLLYKWEKLKCDVSFLETCVQQGLTPNFLRFKLYNHTLHHSRLYQSCQVLFLRKELKSKQRGLNSLEKRVTDTCYQLKQSVSWLDYNHLVCLAKKANHSSIDRVKFVQQRKLKRLGFVSDDRIAHDKVIFNFSDRVLTDAEKSVLSKGLRFAIFNGKLNFIDHFCSFEKLYRSLSEFDLYNHGGKGLDYLKSSLKHLALSSFYCSKSNVTPNISKEEFEALKGLSKDSNIVLIKPDKGNGIVIMNKEDYVSKMKIILNDRSKFRSVDGDVLLHILNKEEKINRYLRQLKANHVIDDCTYSRLFTTGSKPGIMYGLPKVHKTGCPVRPIMSAIGTFNYKLSKFLVPVLSPITTNQYTVKDSFSFAKELCKLNVGACHLASFDVTSLFTNIPLNETVNICTDNLFKDQDTILGFSKEQFHKLLSMAVNDCLFIFNKQMYTQVDGVAMGSPLGPTLANAFLSHYETIWLEQCPSEFKPLLYRRYVDDTFLVFRHKEHVPKFLSYLNAKHDNIQFTSESESGGELPFLDIKVNNCNGGFSTSVYRKPTFTGLTTKFSSFIPVAYKRNLVLTLVTRAYHICSSYFSLHSELQFIKQMLLANGFSTRFTDVYIGKQLTKLLEPQEQVTSVKRATVYFSLSFTGKSSFSLRNKLSKLVREFYPQSSIRVIFRPTRTISSFLKFKDTIPSELQASVVYQYKCHCCNATYIGKTKRQLRVRISEHRGRSIRTNRPLAKPPFSAIHKHSMEADHTIRVESFSVLASRANAMELPLLEALLTTQHRPSLASKETPLELLCF